ncbi:PAS domain-containing sensor histidine kinase [Sphingobacteriaceae bacterium]|nr:PAS domain-containing sensor histidine kinase [Sphingobacteriaceae bacterium]
MNKISNKTLPFLAGGEEMGELTRTFDWSQTSVGSPETWPQSLRTMVSTILRSKFPMFLWWGSDLVQFYNDAYRPSLGNGGKHPSALGSKGVDTWQEIWPVIMPLIDSVLATGESTWSEDQLIPIYRNGRLEDVYWTFSYSLVLDDEGNNKGVLVTCTETTEKVLAHNRLTESNTQLNAAIEASQLATWELNPTTHKFVASRRLKEWFGLPLEGDFAYTDAVNAIPEKDRKKVSDGIAKALTWESGGDYLVEHSIVNNKTGEVRYVRAIGRTIFDEQKQPLRFNGTIQDITESYLAKERTEESQRQLLSLFEESPVGIATLSATDDLVFESANAFYGVLVGRKPKDIIGKPLLDALPELKGQGFDDLLKGVITTAKPFINEEVAAQLFRNNKLETIYVNLTYQPRIESSGAVSGILVVATDVTLQVTSRQKVEESEAKLKSIIAAAPAGIGLFVGRDLIIQNANQTFIDIVGKGPTIEGLPLREAMPELLAEGQPFLKILDDIFETGKPFLAPAALVKIVQNGVLNNNYYNISYTPVFDSDGKVYAILDIAIDVTAQIKTQHQLEEAELSMRGAVELAQLGTWSIDAATNGLTYSDRLIEWFGYDPAAQEYNQVIPILSDADQERVAKAVAKALDPDSDGVYDEIYTVIHPKTGKKRILHAQGKAIKDNTGKVIRMNGTAQDITIQHELQMALENEVQLRTEELEATNEEVSATNEELFKLNDRLTASNEDLSQYAYVASHDLQEPLRKIQVFSNMLIKQKTISEENKPLVNKIAQSAERMTLLIKDLLNFSSLAKKEDTTITVNLNATLKEIIKDFELLISEKHAVINIGALPKVEGVALQMNQLFYNLISNSLKFTQPDVPPIIQISYSELTKDNLATYIQKVIPGKTYYHITVKDNGIGFETKHSDQIFEVFKRLHGKDAYPGSGIGLALCRRIVINHGGHLFTESEPGAGTTFHVILHS